MAALSDVKLTLGKAQHASRDRADWREMVLPYVSRGIKRVNN